MACSFCTYIKRCNPEGHGPRLNLIQSAISHDLYHRFTTWELPYAFGQIVVSGLIVLGHPLPNTRQDMEEVEIVQLLEPWPGRRENSRIATCPPGLQTRIISFNPSLVTANVANPESNGYRLKDCISKR